MIALSSVGLLLAQPQAAQAFCAAHPQAPIVPLEWTPPLPPLDALVVDIALADLTVVQRFRTLAATGRPSTMAFYVDRGRREHADTVQAAALGASFTLHRPVDLRRALDALIAHGIDARRERPTLLSVRAREGITLCLSALSEAFRALETNSPIDSNRLSYALDTAFAELDVTHAGGWLDLVRLYHDGTHQHCLLVAGLAALFARASRWPVAMQRLLTMAALLHDIGKVKIPRSILDKPGPLTMAEMADIRRHPVIARDYLLNQNAIPPQVIRAVAHHHELLDGTGYPDGQKGAQIDQLTRALTCCDILAALIERRAYKPPMPLHQALAVLHEMAVAGKLDISHVRQLTLALGQEPMPVPVVTNGRDTPYWQVTRSSA